MVQKAKESSGDVTPKKYNIFLASKPVDGDRKWLDVTNKYTNDVGTCILCSVAISDLKLSVIENLVQHSIVTGSMKGEFRLCGRESVGWNRNLSCVYAIVRV